MSKLLLPGLLSLFLLGVAGCEKQGPLEEAGENVDEAVEDARNNIEDACEDLTDENC